MIRLEVTLPEGRSYPVLVGPQAAEELASVLPSGVQRVAIVTQPDIPVAVDPGVDHRIFPIPDGETAKTLSTIEELCRTDQLDTVSGQARVVAPLLSKAVDVETEDEVPTSHWPLTNLST